MPVSDEQWLKMATDLATLVARNEAMAREIVGLKGDIHDVKKEVDDIKQMADRWRGATAFLLGIGGLLGGLVAVWGKIRGTG